MPAFTPPATAFSTGLSVPDTASNPEHGCQCYDENTVKLHAIHHTHIMHKCTIVGKCDAYVSEQVRAGAGSQRLGEQQVQVASAGRFSNAHFCVAHVHLYVHVSATRTCACFAAVVVVVETTNQLCFMQCIHHASRR